MRLQQKTLALAALVSFALFVASIPRVEAAEAHAPAVVEAGTSFAIPVEGSGKATFYLVGPDHVLKQAIKLPAQVQIHSDDVRSAGRYRVIVCDQSCVSSTIEVKAAEPAHLSFFLHPSRVPVSTRNSIDATAFVFDRFFNLYLAPATVDFRVAPANGAGFARQSTAHDGVTSVRIDSTPHEGQVRVTAVLGTVQEARVVQQVASEACSLRLRAQTSGDRVILETDPVRDCSGNALPDGTIVSFTKIDREGKTTIDTPIKKGFASTQITVAGPARIGVACGVVLGNELTVNGRL